MSHRTRARAQEPRRSRWALILALLTAAGCSSGSQRFPVHDGAVGDGGTAQCGNGIVEPPEQCDDGNLLNGDGCSPTCQSEACDATTCFTGCCDASGVCVSGVSDGTCGTGGGSCVDCVAGGDVCYEQQCIVSDCSPGETLECGFCGERTCGSSGTLGICEDQGECLPDDIDVGAGCGNCGQLVRVCDAQCEYGPETCTGEGVCEAGTIESSGECGNCGLNQRSCNFQCLWDGWQCVGEGTCPGMNGECCGGACTDTQADPDHCGGCGDPCALGEVCCGGDCADTDTDPLHCGGCTNPCGGTEQCCGGGCEPYSCITGGTSPFVETGGSWPTTPAACPATSHTVGYLNERHYDRYRIYTLCVEGATEGSVTSCTDAPGTCTPPQCPGNLESVGIYVDRSPTDPTERQRICLGAVSGGYLLSCTGPVSNTCTPPDCVLGDVDVGLVKEHEPPTLTENIRICVTALCPPPCP